MDRLTALNVFVAVVEQGSLTAGANHLDISRAMVSRYLAELEGWMGVRLLHRTTRRMSLTVPGEEFLRHARSMLALGEEMELISARAAGVPKGLLRVTCSYSLAETFLMPVVSDYLSQWPGAAIDVLVIDRAVNLVEERIDLAIRITNDLDPNLIARKLGDCRSVVCASPEYLKNRGEPRRIQDLALHNCLTYSYFGKSLWRFNGPDGPESVPVSGNLSGNISNLLLESALLGNGITLQPLYSAEPYLQKGKLIQLFKDYEPTLLGVYGVYSNRKQMSPLLRSFIDYLVEKMSADPLWRQPGC